MDHFGIGLAIKGMAIAYFHASRATGRTTSLVESVKDGDRIVFIDSNHARRVERLCLDRGVNVECIVVDPKTPEHVFDMPTSVGRTIFDHCWIEQRYLHVIERTQKEIDTLERESSGYGEAHRETKRSAEQLMKWQR